MFRGKTILGIILARGDSKRIPNKALQCVGDISLLARTIMASQESGLLDRIILSSDSWFIRPSFLAQDTTPSVDVIEHAIRRLENEGYTYDYVVLLQPTSPLRISFDIDATIKQCIEAEAPACVSVNVPLQSPFLCVSINNSYNISSLLDMKSLQGVRSQDLPVVYCINGAVYVAEVSWLIKNKTFVTEKTVAYVMPMRRSIDIDTWEDIIIAEALR
jgi:N-acylneuraminate cytidylyltransferase